jgi:hypothetical protein
MTDIISELSKNKKAVVLTIHNRASEELAVSTSNLMQGKWHIEPATIPANSTKQIAAKSFGTHFSSPFDLGSIRAQCISFVRNTKTLYFELKL